MSFQDFLASHEECDITRYIEYKASEQNVSLDEAAGRSLGKLFTKIQVSSNPLVIITAFRNERSLSDNRNLNRQLAADIRQLGWGYTPVLGGFLEKVDSEGQQKEIRVHEESFFVNATGSPQQVMSQVVNLLNKYQQEAALIKLPDNDQVLLLSANGATMPIGIWHADPQLMATYYTRMRKGPPNRQFTFEAAGDDSRMTRMIVDFYRHHHR